jgi:hypothetical protein
MNIQLNLTLDVVNTLLTALGQLQGAAQNAVTAIQQQAQAQLQPPAPEEEKAGGTD